MPKVEINEVRCKGCEYCIIFCPKKVLGLDSSINSHGVKPAIVVNPGMCTGCAFCAIMCPDVCIEVWK